MPLAIYNISYYAIDGAGHIEEINSVIVELIKEEVSGGGGGGGGDGDGEAIPGYDMLVLFGLLCVVSIIIITKRWKSIKNIKV